MESFEEDFNNSMQQTKGNLYKCVLWRFLSQSQVFNPIKNNESSVEKAETTLTGQFIFINSNIFENATKFCMYSFAG